MTAVEQTITDAGRGNCLQACVASVLDLPIDRVPHFLDFGDNWFHALELFMDNYGIEYEGTGGTRTISEYEGVDGYIIACGESPRHRHHAVVYKDGEMIHDPHPEGGGIKLESYYMFKRKTINLNANTNH